MLLCCSDLKLVQFKQRRYEMWIIKLQRTDFLGGLIVGLVNLISLVGVWVSWVD